VLGIVLRREKKEDKALTPRLPLVGERVILLKLGNLFHFLGQLLAG